MIPPTPQLDPLLLIGANGMLARAWRELLDGHRIAYTAVDLPQFDLTDSAAVQKLIQPGRFRIVINCSAWTDVDGAEQPAGYALAEKINGLAVGELARQCSVAGSLLVHFSTDYVFDGHATAPIPPHTPPQPLNAYGRSKALGERLLREKAEQYLLIRTSWLYAAWGNNFVRTIIRLSRERSTLKVVDDQRGRPTSARHLAHTVLRLLEQRARGIFHVTDGGECSWFEFARHIARHANPACVVEPCATDQFPRPAKRPPYSVLDLDATENLLGHMPLWMNNLNAVLRELNMADS